MPPQHLLVLAPSSQGHHPEYVRWIVEGALEHGVQQVTIAGPTDLVSDRHRFAASSAPVSTLPLPEFDTLDDGLSLWDIGRRTGKAIRHAVTHTQPTDVLLTYLDHAQFALATGLRFSTPLRVSGILFRPTLHELTPRGFKNRLRRIRKRTLLRLMAANRHMHRVFTLDPDAVAALHTCGLPAVFLPDPVDPAHPTADRSTVRAQFEVEPHRQLAVMFGSLEERKGVFELLEAVSRLDPERASSLAVVIVGRTYDAVRPRLLEAIAKAQTHSKTQILFHEAFVSDADLVNLSCAADLVLAPYRGHVGSSGVMLRAAASRTPVLGPNTGLMHRDIIRHKLGIAVDTSDLTDITNGLARALNGEGFDPDAAAEYAETHSVETFGTILFESDIPASGQRA